MCILVAEQLYHLPAAIDLKCLIPIIQFLVGVVLFDEKRKVKENYYVNSLTAINHWW